MQKNLLISTGGTGGHVIPALTFYDHLKNHFNVSISTDQRGTKFINDTYFYDVIYTPKINSNLFLYPIKLFLLFITIVKSLLFLKKKKNKPSSKHWRLHVFSDVYICKVVRY